MFTLTHRASLCWLLQRSPNIDFTACFSLFGTAERCFHKRGPILELDIISCCGYESIVLNEVNKTKDRIFCPRLKPNRQNTLTTMKSFPLWKTDIWYNIFTFEVLPPLTSPSVIPARDTQSVLLSPYICLQFSVSSRNVNPTMQVRRKSIRPNVRKTSTDAFWQAASNFVNKIVCLVS